MAKVFVVGGGGHAKVVISVLKKGGYDIEGYTDVEDRGSILGVPYLGKDSIFDEVIRKHRTPNAVIGIGKVDTSDLRLSLQDKLGTMGFDFPVICSLHAIVNEGVSLGAGTVVLDGVVINSGTEIGKACILNTNSTVEHDCRIGANVHLSPSATLSGGVIIGDNCMIGTGSIVIQAISICKGTLIGAGSTVVKDITIPGTYVGSPAKRIK